MESLEAEANLKAKGAQMVRLPESDVKKLISAAQEGWTKTAGNDATAQKVLGIVKDFLKSKGYID